MKLLERYITTSVLSAIGLISLVLAGLQMFILFISQMGDLGHGDFNAFEVMLYVFYHMPYQVYLFFPVISLLGALVGLGVLGNNRELLIMRASGMSILQISAAVFKSAFIIIVLVTVLGETIAPKLIYYSDNRKLHDLSSGQTLRTAQGVWFRYLNDFIFVETIHSDNTLDNVSQFHFNETHQLVISKKIEHVVQRQGQWVAHNIHQTEISKSKTQTLQINEAPWDIVVNPVLLKLSSNDPDELTLSQLYRYLRELRRNHQVTIRYQVAFFQRFLQPIATLVMMMLAIPFIFGPLRSSTMGSKLLSGAVIGFSFYIMNRVFGMLGPVIQLPSILVAPTPILLFACLGFYLMKKVR